MKNFLLVGVLCSSFNLGAMNFLLDRSVEGIVGQSLSVADGVVAQVGVEYAHTTNNAALGGYLAPFSNKRFGLSILEAQQDLLLSNYNLSINPATPQKILVNLSPRATRYEILPVMGYQTKHWFFGVALPWRTVEHQFNAQLSPGNVQTSSADVAQIQNYFYGDYASSAAAGRQDFLKQGKLAKNSMQVAGVPDITFMIVRKNCCVRRDFDWFALGLFLRIAVPEKNQQTFLFEPQRGVGGSAQLGIMGIVKLPGGWIGRSTFKQFMDGSCFVHMPYDKVLLPDLHSKGWGHAVLVGIEGMPKAYPAQALANIGTQSQSLVARIGMRIGYEAVVDYRGVECSLVGALRADQAEEVVCKQDPSLGNKKIGIMGSFYPGGGGPSFGDSVQDFELRKARNWIGAKDVFYKPLRPALFGQEVGLMLSKKIGLFRWKTAFTHHFCYNQKSFNTAAYRLEIAHIF